MEAQFVGQPDCFSEFDEVIPAVCILVVSVHLMSIGQTPLSNLSSIVPLSLYANDSGEESILKIGYIDMAHLRDPTSVILCSRGLYSSFTEAVNMVSNALKWLSKNKLNIFSDR